MNCPNCGAAMELRGPEPHFSCSHCGTVHFPEPVSPDIRVLGVEAQAPSCPTCREPLSTATIAGSRFHFCTRCRGMLLDRGLFVGFVQTKRAWATSAPREPAPLDERELRRAVKCPRCGTLMSTHPYYGPGNIVIDGCEPCDLIWLDAGELERVVDAPGRDRGSNVRAGEGAWRDGEPPPEPDSDDDVRLGLFDVVFGIKFPAETRRRDS